MKNTVRILVLSVLLSYAFPILAQSKTVVINGRITSFEESLPLEGASVQVKTGVMLQAPRPMAVSAWRFYLKRKCW